jgi:hypothetical protein
MNDQQFYLTASLDGFHVYCENGEKFIKKPGKLLRT